MDEAGPGRQHVVAAHLEVGHAGVEALGAADEVERRAERLLQQTQA